MHVLLVEIPAAREPAGLEPALARWAGRRLLRAEPAPAAAAAAPDGAAALAAACAVTAGAPVPLGAYRFHDDGEVVAAGAAADAVHRRMRPPGIVVLQVGLSTLPFVEALHADERTRPLLVVGVTSPRLDPDFTLAQKLFSSGKLHYHEHALGLARQLAARLERMQAAHAARASTAAAAAAAAPAATPVAEGNAS